MVAGVFKWRLGFGGDQLLEYLSKLRIWASWSQTVRILADFRPEIRLSLGWEY